MKTELKPLTIYPIDMWPEKLDDRRIVVYYQRDGCNKSVIMAQQNYEAQSYEDYAFMIIPSPEEAYNQVNPRDWENMTVKELREFNESSDVKVMFYGDTLNVLGYVSKSDGTLKEFKSYSEIDGIIKKLQS